MGRTSIPELDLAPDDVRPAPPARPVHVAAPPPEPPGEHRPGRGRPHAPGRRAGGWLLFAALALLFLSCVMSNPPGASSDEPSHLVKAAALSAGSVRGEPVRYERIGSWPASKVAWTSRTARILHVPPGYAGCDGFAVPVDGRCGPTKAVLAHPLPPGTSVSYVAVYPALAYVPSAVGVWLAGVLGEGPFAGLLLARLGGALVALAFIGGAFRLLRRGGRSDLPALAGAALAITPMVVFTSTQVSDSGLEITAALCLGAGLLRLAGPDAADLRPGAVWAWTAAAGFAVTTARPLGPVWLAVITALVLLLRGRQLWLAARAAPRAACALLATLAVGTAASLAWQALFEPKPPTSIGAAFRHLPAAAAQLLGVADMYVGRLGWLGIRLPLAMVLVWLLLIAGLVGVAVRLGTAREKFALAASVVVSLVVTVGLWAYVIAATSPSFVMQARYVIPVLSMMPLMAVDVLRTRVREMERRWGARPAVAAAMVLGLVGLGQATAFEVNVSAFRHSWTPPLRWETWEVAVAFAVLFTFGGVLRALRTAGLSLRAPMTVVRSSGPSSESLPSEADQR